MGIIIEDMLNARKTRFIKQVEREYPGYVHDDYGEFYDQAKASWVVRFGKKFENRRVSFLLKEHKLDEPFGVNIEFDTDYPKTVEYLKGLKQ